MTNIQSTAPRAILSAFQRSSGLRHQLCLAFGLCGAACGQRFELGEVAPPLSDAPVVDLHQVGVVLMDGLEDADARFSLPGGSAWAPIGDVDGDGYADGLAGIPTRAGGITSGVDYGGPRPTDGLFRGAGTGAGYAPEFPTELGLPDRLLQVGDIDGDGCVDLVLAGSMMATRNIGDPDASGLFEPSWGEHRAAILYGDADRFPGELKARRRSLLDPGAQPFPRLAAEATVRTAGADGYDAYRQIRVTGVGDIDSDGFDDLAMSSTQSLSTFVLESNVQTDTPVESHADSYLFFGGPDRLSLDPAANPAPLALQGAERLDAVGDVDGDGYDDLSIVEQGRVRLVAGGPRRGGELDLTRAVAIEGLPPLVQGGLRLGDLDGDGYDDFAIVSFDQASDLSSLFLFYGGAQRFDAAFDADYANASILMASQRDSGVPYMELLQAQKAGDWNGDGKDDLLVLLETWRESDGRYVTGEAHLLPGGTARYSGRYVLPPPSPRSDVIGGIDLIGDLDGDGLPDLAFFADDGQFIKYGGPLSEPIH